MSLVGPLRASLLAVKKKSYVILELLNFATLMLDPLKIESAKNGQFWGVYDNPKHEVKQCYQTGNFNST